MITGTIRVVFGISGGSKKESSDDLDSSSANFALSSWLCSTILEKDFLISKISNFHSKGKVNKNLSVDQKYYLEYRQSFA